MKLSIIAICTGLVLCSCNNETKDAATTNSDSGSSATTTAKTEASKSGDWVPVDDSTAMKVMMEMGTPGEEHKMLAADNGVWKAEVSMWMNPDSLPMKSKGTVTNKMILGGRYQEGTFKGDMMGMPFEGVSTTGYDKARKVWTSSWIDNMSTMIMNMDGKWDDASKAIVFTGEMLCPANGKMCEMKQVYKKIDDNHQVMEMYGPDMKTGKQFKNMEMKLTK